MDKQAVLSALTKLANDAQEQKGDQRVAPQIAGVFNVLLEQAKEAVKDNPVLDSITKFELTPGPSGAANLPTYADIETLAGQIRYALGAGSGTASRLT